MESTTIAQGVAAPETSALIARDLGRRSAADGRWLLQHVNFTVSDGDRIAIVGASGSGKTLLLRALAMLDAVATGEIYWRGEPVAANATPAFRRHVIYLHQRAPLLEGTVEANLRQPFSWKAHADKRYLRERVVAWLAGLGRDAAFLSKQTRDLSGGEAQISALLRAIQLDPNILLLDEPTAALDHNATEAVERLVHDWQSEAPERRATVWVSHDTAQAGRVACRSVRVHDGCLKTEQ